MYVDKIHPFTVGNNIIIGWLDVRDTKNEKSVEYDYSSHTSSTISNSSFRILK